MSGSSVRTFYLFVTKRYNGNFNRFKQDVDTNRNDVIQYNELKSFINDNRSELSGICNDRAISEIWSGMDTFIKGNNELAEGNVIDSGSLNAKEEANVNQKIRLYGEFYDKLGKKVKNLIRFVTDSNIFKSNNLNAGALEVAVLDKVIAACNDSIELLTVNLNNGIIDNMICENALTIGIDMVKSIILNQMNTYVSNLGNYTLANDSDLKSLIDDYISDINYSPNMQFDRVSDDINGIIAEYMHSANISTGDVNYQAPEGCTWGVNKSFNKLQIARLRQLYKDEMANLTIEIYNWDWMVGFEDFLEEAKIGYANRMISSFIDNIESGDFINLYISLERDVEQRFLYSDEFKELQLLQYSTEEEAHDEGDFGCGLRMIYGDDYQSLFYNGNYISQIREAYQAIKNDPGHYGISKLSECSPEEYIQALLQYFTELNEDPEQTLISLWQDYLNNQDPYPDELSANALRISIKNYVAAVIRLFGDDAEVMNKITQLGLDEAHINNRVYVADNQQDIDQALFEQRPGQQVPSYQVWLVWPEQEMNTLRDFLHRKFDLNL